MKRLLTILITAALVLGLLSPALADRLETTFHIPFGVDMDFPMTVDTNEMPSVYLPPEDLLAMDHSELEKQMLYLQLLSYSPSDEITAMLNQRTVVTDAAQLETFLDHCIGDLYTYAMTDQMIIDVPRKGEMISFTVRIGCKATGLPDFSSLTQDQLAALTGDDLAIHDSYMLYYRENVMPEYDLTVIPCKGSSWVRWMNVYQSMNSAELCYTTIVNGLRVDVEFPYLTGDSAPYPQLVEKIDLLMGDVSFAPPASGEAT